jgi:hypothetical protein
MGSSLPAAAAALALLSLLAVGSCHEAQFDAGVDAENFNTSDANHRYFRGWVPARATWYGHPNGAGPDDNGELMSTLAFFFATSPSSPAGICVSSIWWATMWLHLLDICYCRWRLRVQAHQPVPLHVHGLLRQPAFVQGRQGMRILLQGKNPRRRSCRFLCTYVAGTDPAFAKLYSH